MKLSVHKAYARTAPRVTYLRGEFLPTARDTGAYWRRVILRAFWQRAGGNDPGIQLAWNRYDYILGATGVVNAALAFWPGATQATVTYNKLICRPLGSFSRYMTGDAAQTVTVPLPDFNWTELLTLCRYCAAGRVPSFALAGWIEDNLPHPWCRLSSDEPLDLFRAVVPEPLFEGKQ